MLSLTKIRNFWYSAKQRALKLISGLVSVFYIKIYLITVSLLNLINWILAIVIQNKIGQDQIVLHYNVDFGVNLYGDATKIYLIPMIGLVILIINFVVVSNLNKNEKFLNHMLLAASVVSNLFLLIAEAILYFYNFR